MHGTAPPVSAGAAALAVPPPAADTWLLVTDMLPAVSAVYLSAPSWVRRPPA
ncbi:hypothetical protein ABZ512_17925 [Nocardiopsis dassonvillei]|uniref:hypothetical protein n=1 Tax=Nocardiopsis dassonvillei TaxID=2014 RepID=UPI0033D3DB51